jgi:hypothetical protein
MSRMLDVCQRKRTNVSEARIDFGADIAIAMFWRTPPPPGRLTETARMDRRTVNGRYAKPCLPLPSPAASPDADFLLPTCRCLFLALMHQPANCALQQERSKGSASACGNHQISSVLPRSHDASHHRHRAFTPL